MRRRASDDGTWIETRHNQLESGRRQFAYTSPFQFAQKPPKPLLRHRSARIGKGRSAKSISNRRTIVVHGRLAMHEVRLGATRKRRHSQQILAADIMGLVTAKDC